MKVVKMFTGVSVSFIAWGVPFQFFFIWATKAARRTWAPPQGRLGRGPNDNFDNGREVEKDRHMNGERPRKTLLMTIIIECM